MSRAVRKCEKPERCSGFSMWCGMGGHVARWLLAARPEDAGQPVAHAGLFFLRRLGFSGASGLPVSRLSRAGFGFPGLRPSCPRPVFAAAAFCPSGFCRPGCGYGVVPAVPRRPCPAAVAVRGLLAAGSLPLRFRVAGSLSLRFAPARPLSGLTLCGLFLCGSLFLRLLLPSGLCCIRFFPGGLFPAVLCGSQFPGIRVEFQPGQFEDVFQQRASSSEQKAMACPSRPARPVRPMRWT